MATSQKWRYFGFLVFEDSESPEWRKQLKDTHGCYLISPKHAADDDVKKPHYHVIYKHGNPITLDCAKENIPAGIPANGYVEPIRAPRNYQRYLLHLDDPDKEQFPEGVKLLEVLNGFPLDLTRDFSKSELAEQRRRVHELIREFDVMEYADLLDYLVNYDLDLYDYACNHTILFNTYITSLRNKMIDGSDYHQ